MFTNQVAIITGASSGIGAFTAQQLAKRGATVVLVARNEEKLAQVANTIAGSPHVHAADVGSFEQMQAVVAQTLERCGKVDILINNAGFGIFETFAEAPLEDFYEMMRVNYFGTLHGMKSVLPYMLQRGQGHIVNVASMAGKIGSAKGSAYSATKHAVLGLTNCVRQELAGTGIRISAVNPGPVDTPFFDIADPGGQYKKSVGFFMLTPERVATAIINVIRSGKAESNIPLMAAAGVKLYQMFPSLLDRLYARIVNKK